MRKGEADQGSAASAVGGSGSGAVVRRESRQWWHRRQRKPRARKGRSAGAAPTNGARHITSRAGTQGTGGALGRGGLGLRNEGNGNERGERNLFIKLPWQLKGPCGCLRAVGMNFAITAKFMPAPISILQKNTKFNLDKLT